MNTPYQTVGEANEYSAFLTGGDGHDKATLLRRTVSPNLPDIPVLDDDGWQRLIHLIDAAPELLKNLRDAVQYLEGEEPGDSHDAAVLVSLLHYSKVAIDRAAGHPGEQVGSYDEAIRNWTEWRAKAERGDHPGRGFCLEQAERWDRRASERHAEETRKRFRKIGVRCLDAIKHCTDKMKSEEMAADMRLRNTTCDKWSTSDINLIINADQRINNRH